MVATILNSKNKMMEYYQRHEVLVSVITFILGFLFDIYTIRRIDDQLNLLKHGSFLAFLTLLLMLELKKKKIFVWHDLLVHFIFGTLLSAYTIFYFTSASGIAGFFFILALISLMLTNEVAKIRPMGMVVRIVLLNICLLSFLSFLWPIFLGHVGARPFWLAMGTSLAVVIGLFVITGMSEKKSLLLPSLLLHLLFYIAYQTSLIPPVPVALKKIGVYHEVTKAEGNYYGKHQGVEWSLLPLRKALFRARPGDKVMILLSIFSPARFQDRINLKWYFFHPDYDWRLEDTIPLTILGGRPDGFRGFGSKQNYSFGLWRVLVETTDGREVGRINIEIIKDESSSEREFKTEIY